MNASTGATTTFSTADNGPCPVRNSACQTPTGTAMEANPATTNPMTSSLRSIVTSLTVYPEASDHPARVRIRCRHDPPCASTFAASSLPAPSSPAPAWPSSGPAPVAVRSRSRAASSSPTSTTLGSTTARTPIMRKPPRNSATANCQPMSSHSTIPSSTTRFVLANMNTIDDVKSAPRANSVFANALAA